MWSDPAAQLISGALLVLAFPKELNWSRSFQKKEAKNVVLLRSRSVHAHIDLGDLAPGLCRLAPPEPINIDLVVYLYFKTISQWVFFFIYLFFCKEAKAVFYFEESSLDSSVSNIINLTKVRGYLREWTASPKFSCDSILIKNTSSAMTRNLVANSIKLLLKLFRSIPKIEINQDGVNCTWRMKVLQFINNQFDSPNAAGS